MNYIIENSTKLQQGMHCFKNFDALFIESDEYPLVE